MEQRQTRRTEMGQNRKLSEAEGPNWILLLGGALLSTVSIKIGCKIKEAFDRKLMDNSCPHFEENGCSIAKGRLMTCPLHANMCCFKQDGDNCYYCITGMTESSVDIKRDSASPMSKESHTSLPLATVPVTDSSRENGVMWASSPDRLELPARPIQHSSSSDSPCVSESGSDVFSKREVIQKLRQQLKRRDEMILEMQAQITDLQNSVASQNTHSANLQSQLNSTNQDIFDSEREIQRLRKAIADHCVAESGSPENYPSAPKWHPDMNGHANVHSDRSSNDLEIHCDGVDKGRDADRVEMLKREVEELKEIIEGKEFLLQSYKEQKVELCTKVKELQLRLTSQMPNIL